MWRSLSCVCTCSNDSLNTGYSDPYNVDYQIETIAEVIDTQQTSVSPYNTMMAVAITMLL